MEQTPKANRVHIGIFGKRNAGKSSVLNGIIGQDISLVSAIKGTTTDPVEKTIELLPFGPVVFIDTAGIDDEGELGKLRVERSKKIFQRTDFALYVMGAEEEDQDYGDVRKMFEKYRIPHLLVINKLDLIDAEQKKDLVKRYPGAAMVSVKKAETLLELKDKIISILSERSEEETIIGDLLPYDSSIVMVVPVDSEAPKGRIILPQVQLIRDALDHGIKSYVTRDIELESALRNLQQVDLVVTDSQAFKEVSKIVPPEISLTSFSILFARHKGELKPFVEGIARVKELQEGARILISESCTHNHSHEDIGRVKIPKLLNEYHHKEFHYDFKMGHDFPEDLASYDLVIHCGSCMLNKKTMETRIKFCQEKKVPITNYGLILAFLTGILPRSLEIFNMEV